MRKTRRGMKRTITMISIGDKVPTSVPCLVKVAENGNSKEHLSSSGKMPARSNNRARSSIASKSSMSLTNSLTLRGRLLSRGLREMTQEEQTTKLRLK